MLEQYGVILVPAMEKVMSNNGLSGWSCIYCGIALSGPQEGQEHQESGECPGPFPEESKYIQTPRQPRLKRLARYPRTMPPRPRS